MHDAVLYTTELRAPKLEGPAVRLLTWNVASLRSTLKKVSMLQLLHAILEALTNMQLSRHLALALLALP